MNMDNGDRGSQVSPQEAGIDAGIKTGGFFFVAFVWLGYHPLLSLFLGAIAGVCAGCIACWWRITEEPEQVLPEEKRKTLRQQSKSLHEWRQRRGLLRKRK